MQTRQNCAIHHAVRRLALTIAVTASLAMAARSTHATARSFVGPIGGDWNTATNWVPVGVPGGADTAMVWASIVNLSVPTAGVDRLSVMNGSILDNRGYRILVDDLDEQALLWIDDGLLIVSPTGAVNDVDADRLNIDNGGVLLLRNGAVVDVDTNGRTDPFGGGGALNGDGALLINAACVFWNYGSLIASDGDPFTSNGGRLDVTGDGLIGLDGPGGLLDENDEGRLVATEPGSHLHIDVAMINSSFTGTMSIGRSCTIECGARVTNVVVGGSVNRGLIEMSGGSFVAPDTAMVLQGDLVVSSTTLNQILTDLTVETGAAITFADPNAILRINGPLTFDGGTFDMGPGELEPNDALTITDDTTLRAATVDLDGHQVLSQLAPITIADTASLTVEADAIDTAGLGAGTFRGWLRLDGGNFTPVISGGATDFVLTDGGEPWRPARLEMIDNYVGIPQIHAGSRFVLESGGALKVTNQTGGPLAQAQILTEKRLVSGTVEIDANTWLSLSQDTTFEGGTVFTGDGVLSVNNHLDDVVVQADQAIGTTLALTNTTTLRLDDDVTLTLERGLRFHGGSIDNTSGSGAGTAVLLDGDSEVVFDASVSVDTFDWDGVVRGDTFTVDAYNTFMIDGGRLDDGFNEYADQIIIEDNASVIVNTDATWWLRSYSGFPQATIRLAGPDAVLDGQTLDVRFGNVIGNGQILNPVINEGDVIPTHDVFDIQRVGTLTFGSSYLQRPGGRLHLDVDGSGADEFDRIVVDGLATIDGLLHVTLRGGYVPPVGTTFTIVQAESVLGEFSSFDIVLPAGLAYEIDYGLDHVTLEIVATCPDIDGSGQVGFADLTMLLNAWGPCGSPCPEDLDMSGSVGFADVTTLLAGWGACP